MVVTSKVLDMKGKRGGERERKREEGENKRERE